jgi:hypothetical protein
MDSQSETERSAAQGADRRKVAVTLVCAAEDEAAVSPTLERLRADGFEAELVPGVDHQPRRVGEALDRCGEWGIVVVCTSERLDGPELRKVEGVFSARRGPNHAIVRVDLSQTQAEIVAAVGRAVESFAANQGRIIRRPISETRRLREVIPVNEVSSLALPVVRLGPDEELDGDTTRIQLIDNPKAAELSRRRRAARERERERERVTERASTREHPVVPPTPTPAPADEDAAKLDRMMILLVVGAGLLAVLAALSFSGML